MSRTQALFGIGGIGTGRGDAALHEHVDYGEELCAWALLKAGQRATEDEIKAFCKDKIAHYKVPRYIKFVDAFPMTITGKIQKFVMQDQMRQELNLAEGRTA